MGGERGGGEGGRSETGGDGGHCSNQFFKPVNLVWQAGQLAAVESQPPEIAHVCHLVNKLIILRREGTDQKGRSW